MKAKPLVIGIMTLHSVAMVVCFLAMIGVNHWDIGVCLTGLILVNAYVIFMVGRRAVLRQ